MINKLIWVITFYSINILLNTLKFMCSFVCIQQGRYPTPHNFYLLPLLYNVSHLSFYFLFFSSYFFFLKLYPCPSCLNSSHDYLFTCLRTLRRKMVQCRMLVFCKWRCNQSLQCDIILFGVCVCVNSRAHVVCFCYGCDASGKGMRRWKGGRGSQNFIESKYNSMVQKSQTLSNYFMSTRICMEEEET